MRVLGITTSTRRGAAALAEGSNLLATVAYDGAMHHAELLLDAIDALFRDSGADRAALDAVACDTGPGSFTGVRAGLAAAKGIAFGLDLPLVPVGALEAMAAAASRDRAAGRAALFACLVDAKRGETFLAVYDREAREVAPPRHLASHRVEAVLHTLDSRSEGSLVVVGEQALQLGLSHHRVLVGGDASLPAAAWIARLGARRAARGGLPRLDAIDAVYVRAPDAVPQPARPRA